MASVPAKFTGWAATGKDSQLEPWEFNPKPFGDEDIDIKISHCGICGSDLHALRNEWGASTFPLVLGHEITGVVVRVGKKVVDFKPGDRVGVGAQSGACGSCTTCKAGHENNCSSNVGTYNGQYLDGSRSHGGYADYARVHSHFVFKIPDAIDNATAACLLCAGITTFSPFLNHGIKAGDKVGVVGIGGLGHLAIQWGAALGAEVVAISHSDHKREDALKLGAKHFLNMKNKEDVKKYRQTLSFILCTALSNDAPWRQYFNLLREHGKLCLVGLADGATLDNIPQFHLILRNLTLCGSTIGSPAEIKTMLEFAAKHNVKPWIEKYPMDRVNEVLERMRDGKARYRYVLENSSTKASL